MGYVMVVVALVVVCAATVLGAIFLEKSQRRMLNRALGKWQG